MKSGRCPKCKSRSVVTDGAEIAGYRNFLNTGGAWQPVVRLQNYICTDCGYIETYLGPKSRDVLQGLKTHKKWKPV